MNTHTVTVTGRQGDDDTWEEPEVTFICTEAPGVGCRLYPDCDCESWDDSHDHPRVPQNECWMQGWFENDGHSYIGKDADDMGGENGLPEGMNRSGPITAAFQGDYVEWEFVEEAP